MASSKPLDLEITIVSAKHLKNVNWRNGDLKPYATLHLDNSDHRLATHADDSGSTRPVWNERFTLPVTRPVRETILTIQIFHSKPSETPKPLVGSAKFPLAQILDSDEFHNSVYTLELLRPSGRPQGKVRVKLQLKERPLPPPVQDYHSAPPYSHYFSPAAPPPPPPPPAARDYREFSPAPYYSDPYTYYSGYYSPQPSIVSRPPPYPRASSNYVIAGGPSAPVDSPPLPEYKPSAPGCWQRESSYGLPGGALVPEDSKPPHPKVSSVTTELSGAMGGLNLDEGGGNYEKEKIVADRESHSYREYRREY